MNTHETDIIIEEINKLFGSEAPYDIRAMLDRISALEKEVKMLEKRLQSRTYDPMVFRQ